jgi:hypothetical protein
MARRFKKSDADLQMRLIEARSVKIASRFN